MYTIEEYDAMKTKVLKYALYKKRTKKEIEQKFCKDIEESMLEDIMAELEENGYIGDDMYVERAVNEFMALRNLSIKEIRYKLMAKGIDKHALEDYMESHGEELQEYEIESAFKILLKKQGSIEPEELMASLYKKGYKEENLRRALEKLDFSMGKEEG